MRWTEVNPVYCTSPTMHFAKAFDPLEVGIGNCVYSYLHLASYRRQSGRHSHPMTMEERRYEAACITVLWSLD